MTRGALVIALGLCATPGAQEQSVFRARTTVVSVDVSVRHGNQPVAGLAAGDFVLTDNGVPQQIDAVEMASVPIDLTLVIDVSLSTAGRLEQYTRAVREIARLLRPEDRVRVLTFADEVLEVVPLQSALEPLSVNRLSTGPFTALNDALVAALVRRVDLDRRHLIVAFTDGEDTFSVVSTKKVVEIARRADAVLHLAISSRPSAAAGGSSGVSGARRAAPFVESGVPAEREAERLLREAAEATSGLRIASAFFGVDLVGAFRRAFDDFRSSYLLRYRPTGVPLDGWHDIHVKVNRPASYRVRARSGWFGG